MAFEKNKQKSLSGQRKHILIHNHKRMLTFEDFNAVIHSPVADFHKHSPNVILTCCVFFNTRIQSRNIKCIGLFTSLIFFKTASLSLGGVWGCGGGWVWVCVCCAVLCGWRCSLCWASVPVGVSQGQ